MTWITDHGILMIHTGVDTRPTLEAHLTTEVHQIEEDITMIMRTLKDGMFYLQWEGVGGRTVEIGAVQVIWTAGVIAIITLPLLGVPRITHLLVNKAVSLFSLQYTPFPPSPHPRLSLNSYSMMHNFTFLPQPQLLDPHFSSVIHLPITRNLILLRISLYSFKCRVRKLCTESFN